MKYLVITFLYLLSTLAFMLLNFYDNGWQFLQPFLVIGLLIYFNEKNPWVYYTFAALAGILVDSFTGVFGLHAVLFVLILFIIKSLQLTIFTSKNILTIIVLTLFAFVFFWFMFWLSNFIFGWNLYIFDSQTIKLIAKMVGVNLFLVIFFHLLYYNFWAKHHEEKQSF